jgi:hypothetical protein
MKERLEETEQLSKQNEKGNSIKQWIKQREDSNHE